MTLADEKFCVIELSAMGGRTRNFWVRGLQKIPPRAYFQVKGGEQRENCEGELPSLTDLAAS